MHRAALSHHASPAAPPLRNTLQLLVSCDNISAFQTLHTNRFGLSALWECHVAIAKNAQIHISQVRTALQQNQMFADSWVKRNTDSCSIFVWVSNDLFSLVQEIFTLERSEK